jgi:hypothetical protein
MSCWNLHKTYKPQYVVSVRYSTDEAFAYTTGVKLRSVDADWWNAKSST